VTRTVDALDRLEAIPGVAGYQYRGPDLVAGKTVGALSGTTTYDGARRPKSRAATAAGGRVVYSESMAWSSRSLLTAQSRRARNDTAFRMAHDGAGRLTSRSHVGQLTEDPGALSAGTTTLVYDAAQNLVEEQTASTEEPLDRKPMPVATQNRPTSIDGVPLTWDANGNLTAKGDLRFHYDWRNRLTRVTNAGGTEIASYAYDAFNRLVSRTAGSTTETTAWSGWQPVETYEAGQLAERRTFGLGLDELVRLEIDLDGDGSLEQSYTPLYDQVGNLVALAGPAGEIVERYEYSPYGFRVAAVDSIPPEIQQLLYRDGALQVELSEEILRAVLAPEESAQGQVTSEGLTAQPAASTDPPPVSLTVTATSEAIPVSVAFPEELGRYAFRRAVITPTSTVLAAGTEVTLRIESAGLQDLFFNEPAAAFEQTFAWPGGEAVLQDTAAPQVEEVLTRDGRLEIGFSEEVDLTAAEAAITIDGATVAWTLDASGYRLRTVDPLAAGAQTLALGTGVQDLAGTPLPAGLTVDLTAPIATADPEPASEAATAAATLEPRLVGLGTPGSIFYRISEAGRLLTSATGNRFGFHGRELDFATGLVYFRNRWYDPELGRFTTSDPLGYVDGPSLLAFASNDPVNRRDPLGLQDFEFRMNRKLAEEEARRKEMERRLAEGPILTAAPEGSAFRGASVYAIDFATFGLLSDDEAYYAPLSVSGGQHAYTSSVFAVQSANDLRAFRDEFGLALDVVDLVAAARSPGKAMKFVGVALAAVSIFDGIQQRLLVPVEVEGGEFQTVIFDPRGQGSQFRDPATGRFIKTPEQYRRLSETELHTLTVELTEETEGYIEAERKRKQIEAAQQADDFVDVLVESLKKLRRKKR
jgi:RHS repeat-associated protein